MGSMRSKKGKTVETGSCRVERRSTVARGAARGEGARGARSCVFSCKEHLRSVHPDLTEVFALQHDANVWTCLDTILGSSSVPGVAKELAGLSFSVGGLGLSSAHRNREGAQGQLGRLFAHGARPTPGHCGDNDPTVGGGDRHLFHVQGHQVRRAAVPLLVFPPPPFALSFILRTSRCGRQLDMFGTIVQRVQRQGCWERVCSLWNVRPVRLVGKQEQEWP